MLGYWNFGAFELSIFALALVRSCSSWSFCFFADPFHHGEDQYAVGGIVKLAQFVRGRYSCDEPTNSRDIGALVLLI